MTNCDHYPNFIYTGFWIRLFAYCLDLVIIGSATGAVTFFLKDGLLKGTIALLLFLTYFVLMTKHNNGQTLGKMVFGIRVVCFSEETLSWHTVLTRELFGRLLQKTLWILYLLTAFTPKKQHVVDLLCDTSVVTENYLLMQESLRKEPYMPDYNI